MIRGMEHLSHEERLKEFSSLEKRRFWEDLVSAFQYLKGAYKKYVDRLFNKACGDWTRVNGFAIISQFKVTK